MNNIKTNRDKLIIQSVVGAIADPPMRVVSPYRISADGEPMVMPGTGGNPFGVPVLWLGRALGSAYPSPNAPREIETDRFSIGLNGEFSN
ncbi:MAG: hypothetical protein HN757_01350, partial [Calditrichaeota bacterium]|nr:hypothetical protein [Calditrichota bacterium]